MFRIVIEPPRPRLRTRRVDVDLERVTQIAGFLEGWVFAYFHGGMVASTYGYVAQTEVAVAIADPLGDVAVFYGRAPAKGVTGRAAAVNSLPWRRQCGDPADWWDLRCGPERRARARHALEALWSGAFPERPVFTTCLWCVVQGTETRGRK